MVEFDWDEDKRQLNLKKHGLDFRDAYLVFEEETYTEIDERFNYEEKRYYTIGLLKGTTVVIAHTETLDVIRIISLRRAKKHEEELYFKTVRN
jgi:uncharacterized protein